MKREIVIGKVTVPVVDYAIGSAAILGIRDSGKTVTSKGIAEQLLDHGVPIIVFDAVGKWRWMKVAGKAPNGKSYKVVVAGGNAPDLPLTPHSVPDIVRAALKERIPLVIDLFNKTMSKADWRRIVQTAIHIIHYENEGGAVHVFLEEAAEFVPQKIYDGETYAEVEKLVRMGGNASVGITIINQRSQEVNKAVLDNCSTALVLGCQVGKNAIQAVETWIEKLDQDTAAEVTKSLPKLQSGEAWVWTRANLTKPSLERIPMCRSFHPDRRTPESTLKMVAKSSTDTAEFVDRMSKTIPKVIEEQQANDVTVLKRTIGDLKRKLAQAEQKAPEAKQSEPVEVPVFDDECKSLLQKVEAASAQLARESASRADQFEQLYRAIVQIKPKVLATVVKPTVIVSRRATRPIGQPSDLKRIDSPRTAVMEANGSLGKCEKAILRVLAQFNEGCAIGKLALLAGYTQSGSFKNSLTTLRGSGLIEGENTGVMRITDAGLGHGPFAGLPTGEALVDYWLGFPHFGVCERAIINVLRHGHTEINTLCEKAGYELPPSGSFKNSLSTLRSAGVIVGRNADQMGLNPEMFQ